MLGRFRHNAIYERRRLRIDLGYALEKGERRLPN